MARLPQPGGDPGQWGSILNEFLSQAHNSDGSLKNTGLMATKYSLPTEGIPKSDLHADVQAALDTAMSGIAPDASTSTKGIIRLAGDLTGDALVPLVAPNKILGASAGASSHIQSGTITNTNIHASAAIAKSKLAPLAIVNEDVAVGAAIAQSKIQNLVSDIATLTASVSGKANTSHTHDASSIANFADAAAAVIGDRIQAGSNVTVNYDLDSGITTISATGTGTPGEPSESVLTVAGRTGDVVLGAGDIVSGTFTTNRIPNLDTSKLTTGTLSIDRLPTGATSSTVALGNHTHSGYAASSHTHDDRYYTESEIDAALSSKLNSSERGIANGVATLGSDGKLPASQLPALAIKETFTVASQSAMLALTAQRGDMAIRTDNGKTYVLATDSPATLNDWKELTAGGGSAVTSVAGRTGAVTLAKADVGLGNVDNTSDANKPISTATQNALNALSAEIDSIPSTPGFIEYTGSAWPARPSSSGIQIFTSTKNASAPEPSDMSIGDIWIRHPDALETL